MLGNVQNDTVTNSLEEISLLIITKIKETYQTV